MLRLGFDTQTGDPVELTLEERKQGTYIIGTTGTGKSTLLKNIVYQDMVKDRTHGLCVLDPHGDLIDELLLMVPEERKDDVILFNPMDMERPYGLNLLDCDRDDPVEVRWVLSTVMGTLRRLFYYSWGPQLEHVLRHTLLTAMHITDATFIELLLLLSNPKFQQEITKNINEPLLKSFWKDFPKNYITRMDLTNSTINKLTPFLTDRTMRNIIGQPKNTINFEEVMDKGKILFVNLSKGDLGEENSSLLGSVIVNLILIAALKRRDTEKVKRRQFHLIADEFQNFASESFSILQSEARKYGVDVVVAHQFRDQLDLNIKGSTLNVGNIVVFRVTGRDSYDLASQFDNTPPPPETSVEPVYGYYAYQGHEFLVETRLNTGEGKLYQEVEDKPRPYNDVEAEMANRLSVLPDYQALCRLVRKPEDKKKRPKLDGYQIITEDIDQMFDQENDHIKEERKRRASHIREHSKSKAKTQEEVEEDIERRSLGEIKRGEDPDFLVFQDRFDE
jgi:hypothetical protein